MLIVLIIGIQRDIVHGSRDAATKLEDEANRSVPLFGSRRVNFPVPPMSNSRTVSCDVVNVAGTFATRSGSVASLASTFR